MTDQDRPAPQTEAAQRWADFERWEHAAMKAGSGMTRDQMTGATMFDMWLREREAAAPALDVDPQILAKADAAMRDETGRRRTRNAYYWRDLAAEYARLTPPGDRARPEAGLTKAELVDIFDRTADRPHIREKVRRLLDSAGRDRPLDVDAIRDAWQAARAASEGNRVVESADDRTAFDRGMDHAERLLLGVLRDLPPAGDRDRREAALVAGMTALRGYHLAAREDHRHAVERCHEPRFAQLVALLAAPGQAGPRHSASNVEGDRYCMVCRLPWPCPTAGQAGPPESGELLRGLAVAVGDYTWALSPRDATGKCRLCDATEGLEHDPAKPCGRLNAAYLAALRVAPPHTPESGT